MPEKKTLARARRDRRQGKAATTQAGEFVREEMEHAKSGKHPVRSRKQAIAIGLSKARRSGVKVPPKKGGGRKGSTARKAGARRGTSSARKTTARKAPARKSAGRTTRRRSG